jgi:hypothetical protein
VIKDLINKTYKDYDNLIPVKSYFLFKNKVYFYRFEFGKKDGKYKVYAAINPDTFDLRLNGEFKIDDEPIKADTTFIGIIPKNNNTQSVNVAPVTPA